MVKTLEQETNIYLHIEIMLKTYINNTHINYTHINNAQNEYARKYFNIS